MTLRWYTVTVDVVASLFCILFVYLLFFFSLARQPPVGQGLLIHEVSKSHTTTQRSRLDSSGRMISSQQRPLPDNTQHSQHITLTTHNTHNRQTSMLPVGFEPTTQAGERPQTYALDRTVTWIGSAFI